MKEYYNESNFFVKILGKMSVYGTKSPDRSGFKWA